MRNKDSEMVLFTKAFNSNYVLDLLQNSPNRKNKKKKNPIKEKKKEERNI